MCVPFATASSFRFVVQATDVLDKGAAKAAVDIDFLLIMVLGFPPNWGGVLAWCDKYGAAKAAARIEELADQLKLGFWRVSPRLQAEAARGGQFRPELTSKQPPQGAGLVPALAPVRVGLAEATVVALVAALVYRTILPTLTSRL